MDVRKLRAAKQQDRAQKLAAAEKIVKANKNLIDDSLFSLSLEELARRLRQREIKVFAAVVTFANQAIETNREKNFISEGT